MQQKLAKQARKGAEHRTMALNVGAAQLDGQPADLQLPTEGAPPPVYDLMDRSVQPPGYNLYREKKESFTDCTWHCSFAECCMCYYVFREKGHCPGSCLGTLNAQLYFCCMFVPLGRFCPGRTHPCCCCKCAQSPGQCCSTIGCLAPHDRAIYKHVGPGWVKSYGMVTQGKVILEEVVTDRFRGATLSKEEAAEVFKGFKGSAWDEAEWQSKWGAAEKVADGSARAEDIVPGMIKIAPL